MCITLQYEPCQQCGILTSVDSHEPVQPPVKIRNSKWCSVRSLILIGYSSNKQRLSSDCAYGQADLRLCWSHIPYCWKSRALAHISIASLENSVDHDLDPHFFIHTVNPY